MDKKFVKALNELKTSNKNFQGYSITEESSSFIYNNSIIKPALMVVICVNEDYTICKASINNKIIDQSKNIECTDFTAVMNNSDSDKVKLHINIDNLKFYNFVDESDEEIEDFVFIYNENEHFAESIILNGKNHINPKISQLVFKKRLPKEQFRILCFDFLQIMYPDFFIKITDEINKE